jgi:hypothetical protein
VNLSVAKDQRLSLNPTQISGACGRLMCSLRYEHDFYVQQRKRFPKEGKILTTAKGEEKVVANDIFRERVTLRAFDGEVRVVPLAELRGEMEALGGPFAAPRHRAEPDAGGRDLDPGRPRDRRRRAAPRAPANRADRATCPRDTTTGDRAAPTAAEATGARSERRDRPRPRPPRAPRPRRSSRPTPKARSDGATGSAGRPPLAAGARAVPSPRPTRGRRPRRPRPAAPPAPRGDGCARPAARTARRGPGGAAPGAGARRRRPRADPDDDGSRGGAARRERRARRLGG